MPVIDDYGHEASSTNGAHFNQSWYGVNVYLNTLNSSNRVQYNSTTLIGMIITHEFGHALKIKHPHGENAQYVKSIMNQSLSTTNQLTPVSPSEYDKRTLILKWGG